jgi:Peptidase family M23
MMLLIRFLLISILYYSNLNEIPKNKSLFISPIKIPQYLSANFGELRIDHFHSGLDIKTQGVTGKEVVAAANGYIYRISVSPGGFGKALYIRHPSGYSTVYGHLERFNSKIENYVKTQQYARKSFQITLFPEKEEFPIKQGELIAYSGNSGTSGGPHLHFEIRNSGNEKPINPLLFEFGIADDIPPVIEKLVIYPVNHYSLINNQNTLKKVNVTGGHGVYYLAYGNEITIKGLAGFGVKAYDMMNGSPNRVAVYSIDLSIDSTSVFSYIMDGFSFDESRYVNSHIDYETYMRDNIYFERAFVLPDDKLSVYKHVIDRGLFNFSDNKLHNVNITVTDANNNKSVLTFKIKGESEKAEPAITSVDNNIIVMPYERSNKFSAENILVNIPSGALYDTLYFLYKSETGTGEMLSDLYTVHNKYTPVHKAYSLSIKPKYIPAGKDSKMLIVQLSDDQKKSGLNSTWENGFLSADALSFGRFYVGIDTIAPVISAADLVPGVNLTGQKEIRIRITDELSGIKSYEPSIDDKWALFEYDQKNDMLIYRFDETRIRKGSDHNLSLKVTDNKDNSSNYSYNFKW